MGRHQVLTRLTRQARRPAPGSRLDARSPGAGSIPGSISSTVESAAQLEHAGMSSAAAAYNARSTSAMSVMVGSFLYGDDVVDSD